MARIVIVYSTGGGQTAKIAGRMADVMRRHGHAVDVVDVAALPADLTPATYDAAIVGAAIQNRHLPTIVRDFITTHRAALADRPTAFFSVSLGAASRLAPLRRFVERLVDVFLDEAGWRPGRVGCFAGLLPYAQFSWMERQIALLFMAWPGGGSTSAPGREYTDWAAVERFAEAVLADLAATPMAVTRAAPAGQGR